MDPSLGMAVLGNDQALVDLIAEEFLRSLCHLPGSLAYRNNNDLARSELLVLQRALYGLIRKAVIDSSLAKIRCSILQ